MSELKPLPCKKCGWSQGRRINYGHFRSKKITYRMSCPRCGYCTKEKETVEEAIDAWNRRVKEVEIDQFNRVGFDTVEEDSDG